MTQTDKPAPTLAEARRVLERAIRQINSVDVTTDSDSVALAEGVKGVRQAFDVLESKSAEKALAEVRLFLLAVLPYLKVKREQAKTALAELNDQLRGIPLEPRV